MSTISRRILLLSSAALAGAAFLGPALANDLKITIGYQTVVEPSKVPRMTAPMKGDEGHH